MRPTSVEKPSVIDLQKKGVAIVPVDIATASLDELQDVVRGADTVISVVVFTQLGLQHKIMAAAKSVGVTRFVPCDFGTPGRRGVRELHDEVSISSLSLTLPYRSPIILSQKLDIRDAVKASGLGYTFIDVGFWYVLQVQCTFSTGRAHH